MEMKEKDNDSVRENISRKNRHQSNNNEEERKLKGRKRKKNENENDETKFYEELHEMQIKRVCTDVKRIRIDSEDKIRKVKTKEKEYSSERCYTKGKFECIENSITNLKQPDILKKKKKKKKKKHMMDRLDLEDYDQKYNNFDKHPSNNEVKRKSKSRKRKKEEKDNHFESFLNESHKMKTTKEVHEHVKRIRTISEDKIEKVKTKNHIKENFSEKCFAYEEKECIENNISNYKQPDVFKKKKKKCIMDKRNLKGYDTICNDYDDKKNKAYTKNKRLQNNVKNSSIDIDVVNKDQMEDKRRKIKKKKKRKKSMIEEINKDSSNMEIGKVNENNDKEKNYTQVDQTVLIEQSIPVEESGTSESDTENIHSLYSHEYTNDPNRLNSRKVISNTNKKEKGKKTIEMYEDFIYKLPVTNENHFCEIENVPQKDSYWVKHNVKYKVDDYPQEVIQKDLLERVKYIADYFDRFDMDNLTEEECQEKEVLNFEGPYLPTPCHIKAFGNLEIELDWEMSEEQQLLLSFQNIKDLRESGVPYITEPFDRSEDSMILENWLKFKEQYKLNDLRPLLAFRTMKVNHEEGCFNFKSVDYIDEDERQKFFMYMARGLENRNIFQIKRRLMHLAMRIRYYGISYDPINIKPREAAEIEAFIKLFGTNYKGMEFIIGKVNSNRYQSFSQMYVKYKNMPIRIGQWQSTEKCRLVRSIFKATGASNIQELLHSKFPWKEVFLLMQTRLYYQCRHFFTDYMSRFLELATHISDHKTDSGNIYWTTTDRIKLLNLVSKNLGPTVARCDWEEVSSHFEIFGPYNCLHQFRLIYNKTVPRNKRKKDSMEEAIDYILEFVVPKIEKGEITFKEESLNLEELQSLPLKKYELSKSSAKWSLNNTIKLIKEVYENAGSSVETTDWEEICINFLEYDEKGCRNHFRYLYYNRVPHQHRTSFDSALEYLKNRICPMLENKKQRNMKEFLFTEEVVALSPEDRLILQALLNDISHADDDEDVAMLLEENYDQLNDLSSQIASNVSNAINQKERTAKLNELSNYIQEKQDDEDIDGNLNEISDEKIESYIDDFHENLNLHLHLSTDYEQENDLEET